MNIEILIYIYALICIALIGFDCLWSIIKYFKIKQIQRSETKFYELIEDHLNQIHKGKDIEKKQSKSLVSKLKNVDELKAFHLALQKHEDRNSIDQYMMKFGKILTELSKKYEQQRSINKAYFAYVISQHSIYLQSAKVSISEYMIGYLYDKSVYCRENALHALYQFGDEVNVVRALKILDSRGVYYNSKLLTDGLYSFKGNHEKLSLRLLETFPAFQELMQISIINYLKLIDVDFSSSLFVLLSNTELNPEIRFALIRYFGKHTYSPAKEILLRFLKQNKNDEWELSALSARALSNYEDEQVIEALKSALTSKNWYVRLNAASSLCEMNINEQDILDIINGDDRFAREILQYSLNIKNKLTTTKVVI